MKLSEKGWDKVLDEALYFDEDIANESLEWSNDKQEYKLRHMEFEPDDLEGVVCLSVEEAKAIAYKLGYLGALTTQSKTEKETLELTDMLWWRIEQAEKGNESD